MSMDRCQGCGWPPSTPCPTHPMCIDGFGIDIPEFLRRAPGAPQARRQTEYKATQNSRFVDRAGKRRPWHWPKGADPKTPEGRAIIAMIKGAEREKDRAQAERFKQLRERNGR